MLNRYFIIALLAFFNAQMLSAKGLVGLLADPEKYENKEIVVAGFLGAFSEMTPQLYSIYLTKNDSLLFNIHNSVAVFSKEGKAKFQQCANTYVVIEGVVKRDSDFGFKIVDAKIVIAQSISENDAVELVFCGK